MSSGENLGQDVLSLADDFGPFEPIVWSESDGDEEYKDPFGLCFTPLDGQTEGPEGIHVKPSRRNKFIVLSDSEGEKDGSEEQRVGYPVGRVPSPCSEDEQRIGDLVERDLAPCSAGEQRIGDLVGREQRIGDYVERDLAPCSAGEQRIGDLVGREQRIGDSVERDLAPCSAGEQRIGDPVGRDFTADVPECRPPRKGLVTRTLRTGVGRRSKFKPNSVRPDYRVPYTELRRAGRPSSFFSDDNV